MLSAATPSVTAIASHDSTPSDKVPGPGCRLGLDRGGGEFWLLGDSQFGTRENNLFIVLGHPGGGPFDLAAFFGLIAGFFAERTPLRPHHDGRSAALNGGGCGLGFGLLVGVLETRQSQRLVRRHRGTGGFDFSVE
jgi:hypothetical protein